MLTKIKDVGLTYNQLNEYSLLSNRAIEIKHRDGILCIDIRPRYTRETNKYSSRDGLDV